MRAPPAARDPSRAAAFGAFLDSGVGVLALLVALPLVASGRLPDRLASARRTR
ncbi:hypothetical protein AB0D78_13620 [Streptomyces avermitilis]|uniref:hypothetical protein n=1 Tax=Streptomyces avermitilis TaxID=33903 RepID=UPI0033F847DD